MTLRKTGLALAAALTTLVITPLPLQARQAADGRVFFDAAPRLVDTFTSNRTVSSASRPSYSFDLTIPADVGEPLQQVAIAQLNGESEAREIEYDLERTQAFTGKHRRRGDELLLSNVSFNDDTQTIVVTFDTPVPPGTDVTIRLRPERNPRREGTYQFGITAFPAGEQPQGLFLGIGRLQFFDRGDAFTR
ncbi:MAG: DUF2808 domain-containing protein [Cyanobacteria bacterium P01_A01_bin.135]